MKNIVVMEQVDIKKFYGSRNACWVVYNPKYGIRV